MQIAIVLSLALGQELKASHRSARVLALNVVLHQVEARLEPVHPGTTDPELSRYFTAIIDSFADASAVCDRLANVPGVEGAYIKPEDALP